MNVSEKANEYIVGKWTFPFSNYLLNRRSIISTYKGLIKSERSSKDYLRDLQFKRLTELINYANKNIPFYRNRFREIGLNPEDIQTFEDIESIPPLSRQDVIDNYREMVDERFRSSIHFADNSKGDPGAPRSLARFRKHKLVRNTSSGSTGAPTVFYENGSRTALNWAHELRLKSWYGLNPGAREGRMVRLSADYMPKSRVILMRNLLWGQLILPGVNLGEEEYEICLNRILEYRPRSLWGFTSALTGLGKYILDNRKDLGAYRPEVVTGWAAPVYDHEKEILEKAFNCSVTNNYGAREVGHVAGMCPQGAFHINQENLLVESEKNTASDSEGDSGELLVTTLDISPMPFIRYRMGDIGDVTESSCECGRNLQILVNFLGRTGEIFITKDGRMISPNFWCRTFMSGKVSGAVRRFQVIYKKSRDLRIIIEKDVGFSNEAEKYITDTVARNFSSDTMLEISYVPKIEPQISGKYQMVVNETVP